MSTYHEAPPQPAGTFDPAAIVRACVESGAPALLLDEGALPPEFFDLSTRLAGDLVQRVTLYHIRMAGVVPDPSVHSRPFQDFAREAGHGGPFRFFPSREEAVAWLNQA